MKKNKKKLINILTLIFILILLITNCSTYKKLFIESDLGSNRTKLEFKNNSIEVDNELLPYVKEFMIEAAINKINVDSISKTYMGIYIDDKLYNGMWGLTIYQNSYLDYSLINNKVLKKNTITRLVVFHELSHKYLNKKHCHITCNQIMSAYLGDNNFNNNWKQQKKILFKNITHYNDL